MTSPPKLSIVGHPPPPRSRYRSEAALRQWDCEAQLVGALMHLPATHVASILTVVPADAIWQPDNRWAYEIIGDIVACGDDPDPVVVLHTARHRPPSESLRPGDPITAARHHHFAIHLTTLYTQTVNPALARQYARAVLEDAYRRAVEQHGIAMIELARSDTSPQSWADYLTTMRATLAELWRRIQAAAR